MYGTVVVPLDESPFAETALRPAAEIAAAEGAQLVLLSASDVAASRAYLHEVAERQSVTTTVKTVATGEESPGAVIARVVAERPDTLLCMATHGRSGVRRAVLGSVTEDVVRTLDEPILLTGPSYTGECRILGGRMLVCLDGSDRAEAILPHALSWAKAFDMKLWLATVQKPAASEGDVLESNYLSRIAHDLDRTAPTVNWDTLHGPHPANELVDLAARIGATCLAVTTHGRTGLSRVAVGSVAMDVAHRSTCPVLVQRSS